MNGVPAGFFSKLLQENLSNNIARQPFCHGPVLIHKVSPERFDIIPKEELFLIL